MSAFGTLHHAVYGLTMGRRDFIGCCHTSFDFNQSRIVISREPGCAVQNTTLP